MQQSTFAEVGFDQYRKQTRRGRFLAEMEQVIPWDELCALIEPVYPKVQGAGRRPIGIERMLRIHFLQHWFNLSDPAVEDALHDSHAMQRFVGIDLGKESAPDETTVCKFRHLLEAHELGKEIFKEINKYLKRKGLKIGGGTIVDATILRAPSSRKNKERKVDAEMKSTRKGRGWHFGMKAHIGVSSDKKLIHSVEATPANVHDSQVIRKLLHGKETKVWGDSAYTGQKEAIREAAPKAKDYTNKRGSRYYALTKEDREKNRRKSKVRAKVEHPFYVMKRLFGFRKLRYRGIAKNRNRIEVMCGLINLFMSRKRLLRLQ